MPFYEYKCQNCKEEFEELQPMGATNENIDCPTCGTGEPVRIMSGFAACTGGSGGSSAVCGPSGFS